jgi:hypothetical protein
MKYSSIAICAFLVTSISSRAFFDSDISQQDRKELKSNPKIQEKEVTIFKPVFQMSPPEKDIDGKKTETVAFEQFKPDTSPNRNRERPEYHPVAHFGQQRDLHPGSPRMKDFDVENQYNGVNTIPSSAGYFLKSLFFDKFLK